MPAEIPQHLLFFGPMIDNHGVFRIGRILPNVLIAAVDQYVIIAREAHDRLSVQR
jgi:hypothetical protein